MSTYNYAPPPPPPPTSGGASYGQSSSTPYGQNRGGGSGSRRGGHYHGSRGDYHSSQPRYEYTGQPYPAQHAVPYGSSHPPANSYPTAQPQWAPDHSHASAHHAHPHAPVPLSATNYHPNYAPQPYAPSQYPQQAPYAAPQPYPYQAPPPPPSQAQWSGQGTHQTYGNSRGRGGSYSDRGGHKPSQGVPPVRHEYDAAPPPIVGGFPQPYPPDPRVVHYPPPQYAYAAPPPPPVAARHQDSSHGQYPRRGRGGHRDGHGKGRGSHHSHHHGANDKTRPPKPPNNNVDNSSKPDKSESPSVGKKKKRKTNTLGLTPGVDSETEDDEGEEKTLTELIGQETLNISDVAAFIAERKKKFPTRARIEAKKAAELARKEEDKAASLEKEADRLRKQLRRVEFSIKRKREQGDEGDEMREPSDDSSDDEPEVMSSRTQTAPPPSSSSSAKKADITRHCKYYSTGGTCGKKGKCRFVHDPQAREAAIKEREANNGRLTIQQRLILNDKEQEDLAILQSIQYLREKGLMNTAGASAAVPPNNEEKKLASTSTSTSTSVPTSTLTSTSAPTSVSTLPPSTSSLPAIPPQPAKREPPRRSNPPPSIIPTANSISAQGLKHYQGWLLKPYGSSSGKQSRSDDLP